MEDIHGSRKGREGGHMVTEGQARSKINKSRKVDFRESSTSKRSFLYTKIVPVALVALLIALFATLIIVGLSVIGFIPGG